MPFTSGGLWIAGDSAFGSSTCGGTRGEDFSGESRGYRYLASRVSFAARLPRDGPGSGRLRPARCEVVPAI